MKRNDHRQHRTFTSLTLLLVIFLVTGTGQLALVSQNDGDTAADGSAPNEEEAIENWVKNLSSDKRPVRQEAARNLVLNDSTSSTRATVRVLSTGIQKEKEAILTIIASAVSGDRESVEHLLKPMLRRHAQTSGDGGSVLVEAVSYYPAERIQTTIHELLVEEPLNGTVAKSQQLLEKARLIRLLGSERISMDPIRTGKLLISMIDSLPEELHPDILQIFQSNLHVYSISTVEQCRDWWNEHRELSPDELFRNVAERTTDRALKDWKNVVTKLFSAHGTGSAKLYADLLETPDPRKQLFLLNKLRETPPESDRSLLGEKTAGLLSRNTPARVSLSTLKTVEQLELTGARAEVEGLLSSFRPAIRAGAASALGQIGNEESGNRLTEQFKIEDIPDVSVSIVQAIRELDHKAAVPELKKRLLREDDFSSGVQKAIVQALGTLGQTDSLQALTAFLNRTDPESNEALRFEIADSLGQLQHPRAVPPLVRLTNDPNASVRVSAAQALGNISFDESDPSKNGDLRSKALDALFELLKNTDEDTPVRRRAASSIASTGTASSIARLTGLVIENPETTPSYIEEALIALLKKHPDRLLRTARTLQENDLHPLVAQIDEQFDLNRIEGGDELSVTELRFLFARTHLELENWSTVITRLKNIEETSGDRKEQQQLMRIRAFIGLSNFSEAKSHISSLLENTEEGASLWWKLQVLRTRLDFRTPPPATALERVDDLLKKSPPSDVASALKRIREKHKTNVETIERILENITGSGNSNTDPEDVQTLINLSPYHHMIVRKSLDLLPSDPEQAKRLMTPALAKLMGDITGRKLSLSDETTPEQVKDALDEWAKWLENRTAGSDESSE